MKRVAIIGSTGSIGTNALRVIRAHPHAFSVVGLAAKQNAEFLYQQAKEFRPRSVCLFDEAEADKLRSRLKPLGVSVLSGSEGLIQIGTMTEADLVVFSVVGSAGLLPIVEAIKAHKSVAIANKEPLVMAGDLLVGLAAECGVSLIPIDSEHSGLWQCLEGRDKATVKKLILTSSGGPFFKRRINFRRVTPKEALQHPRWKMGPKITVDSATLMNKGLEVIEAAGLFGVSVDQIEVLIHPEAVVHALVEFVDGSQLAQLGITDMRLPIQYALSYPGRLENSIPCLNLTRLKEFHFFAPERRRFPCLELGYEAKRKSGTMPAVLNGANEVAVEGFLRGDVTFDAIPKIIERVMRRHQVMKNPTLDRILEADQWARTEAEALCLNS